MKKISIHLCCLTLLLSLYTCRKKTSVKAIAFNYALNEPIANATILLLERKYEGSLFGPTASCKEIASTVSDENGACYFDKEKLKTSKKYSYYLAISNAYGQPQSYNCSGKTSGFIDVGKPNQQTLNASTFDAFFKVQYNNLLNPAQTGDSLYVYISSPKYSVPDQPYPFGGGGVFISFPFYGSNGYPFPATLQTSLEKTNAGKHVMTVYKKKLGLITQTVDTIKIYPYETKIIEINW